MSISTIREILGDRQLHSVTPDETLGAVARLMEAHRVGAVAIVEGGALKGILTERDLVFRGLARGLPADSATAAQVMTREPVTVDVEDAISDALAVKLGDAFRHLPVMEDGRVVGLLSYRDIPPEYVMMFERFREMASSRASDGV